MAKKRSYNVFVTHVVETIWVAEVEASTRAEAVAIAEKRMKDGGDNPMEDPFWSEHNGDNYIDDDSYSAVPENVTVSRG